MSAVKEVLEVDGSTTVTICKSEVGRYIDIHLREHTHSFWLALTKEQVKQFIDKLNKVAENL